MELIQAVVMKEKLIRNTISCGASSTVSILVNFLLMPFMISRLGVTEYGLIGISAIFTVGGCVSLLEMGFQSSISKYVAEYNSQGNHTKIAKMICTSAAMFFLMGVLLTTAGILLSRFIMDHCLKIPQEYHPSFRIALVIVFISYIFQFPNFVVIGFLSGMQRFDILKGSQIAATLLYSGGVVFLLCFGHHYLSLIAFQTCVLFLQFGFCLSMIVRRNEFLRFRLSNFSIGSMREVFRMTKFLLVSRLSDLVFHNAPRIVVGIFLGPVLMTSYEAVIKISRIIKAAFGFVNSAIMPAASELYASRNTETLRRLFLKACLYQVIAVFPIVSAAMFLARRFYAVWLGPDFAQLAPLLWIALVFNLAAPFITVGGAMMIGMNRKLKSLTVLSVSNTLLSVAIMLLLIQRYGLAAVFVGLSVSTLVALPFYLKMFLKEFSVEVEAFLRDVVVIVVLAVVPLCLVLVIGRVVIYNNYFTLFLKGFTWCLSYWSMLYIFVLDGQDRDMLKGLGRTLCWQGK